MIFLKRISLELTQRTRTAAASAVHRRCIHQDNKVFRVSEEIRTAVNEKRPVVALETTIYTHGFPYPDNLDLSAKLEALVRHNGGVPAHCAVLDGIARVGLESSEMEHLVRDPKARKVSRRDLGFLTGLGLRKQLLNGGTTIAGTMILAHLAGIKVFATGGLGGVHRGVESTMDISADLTEFGRTPVAVISAGCKGFLDIPRTLEYLETEGAFVGTFADGREGDVKFPAFWCRESDSVSPLTVKDEHEAAAIIPPDAQSMLGLTSGLFFPNPVPEEHAIPSAEMSNIIDEALRRADAAGIIGSANTPFVLNAIRELSQGRSIPANVALIEANVVRSTRVAVELSRLERGLAPGEILDGRIPASAYLRTRPEDVQVNRLNANEPDKQSGSLQATQQVMRSQADATANPVDLLVVGSVAVDLSCDYTPLKPLRPAEDVMPKLHTSNPAMISQHIGGVGHNVVKAAHLAGGSAKLCSVVGNDITGIAVKEALGEDGLATEGLISSDGRTAQYVAINDGKKDLVYGMADMSIFEQLCPEAEDRLVAVVESSSAKWLVADTNWTAPFLQRILNVASHKGIKTAFEPVSVAKSHRIFSSMPEDRLFTFPRPLVNLTTPNMYELSAMYTAARDGGLFERQDWWRVVDAFGISSAGARVELAMATSSELVDRGIPQQTIQLLPFIPCILTKLGSEGVLLTQLLGAKDMRLSSPTAAPHILSRSRSEGEGVGGIYMRMFPPVEIVKPGDIVSVNGVGDTLLGVLMATLTRKPNLNIEDAVDLAQRAAILTLKSSESVSPHISSLRLALEMS